MMQQLNNVPIGTIVAFYGVLAPLGWLFCNGSTITESAYPKLFALTGAKLPDLRGEFIRGLDNGRGIDIGRTLGSEQGDAIRNITGTFGDVLDGTNTSGAFSYSNRRNAWDYTHNGSLGTITFDASRQVPTAQENRPRNIALNYIIKAQELSEENIKLSVANELNNKIELLSGNLSRFAWTNENNSISKAQNGYCKLANGMIMQWGRSPEHNGAVLTTIFPITFNSPPQVTISLNYETESTNTTHLMAATCFGVTTTSFKHTANFINGGSATVKRLESSTARWIAIGY